jgi:hypothetical protein
MPPPPFSLMAPVQHTSPDQVCRALCFGMRGRGSAGGGHPSDPGGVTVSQQSRADRRRGRDAARGSERGESSTRPALLVSCVSVHPSICTSLHLGVRWACGRLPRARAYVRTCAGRARKRCCVKRVWGKRTMSSPCTLACVRARMCARLPACVCSLCVYVFICLQVCVCVRACLHLYKQCRGPPRCMQRADHHQLLHST